MRGIYLLLFLFSILVSEGFAQKPSHSKGRALGGSFPDDTKIATPKGDVKIKNLKIGDEVWSTDYYGKRLKVKIKKLGKVYVRNAQVLDIKLKDKRSISAVHKHPDGSYKALLFYKVGDSLDGSEILKLERRRIEGDSLWDILPEGLMATYWANGVLLTSSMLEAELNEIKRGGNTITRVYKPWGDNDLIQKYEKEHGCIYNPAKDAKIKGQSKEGIDSLIKNGIKIPYEERINARMKSAKYIIVIDKAGKISKVDVNESINKAVDEACIESIRSIPPFTPASQGDENVATVKKVHIEFDMYGNVKRVKQGRLIFNEEFPPNGQNAEPKVKTRSSIQSDN